MDKVSGSKRAMTEGEYQNALRLQDQIHGFIRIASDYERKGQHQLALQNYLKAYEIQQCAGLIAVCRGAIADNYEAIGQYQKALEHIDWFLAGLNPSEPLFVKMTQTRQRLLQKIEEQKREEKTEESKPASQKSHAIRSLADFETASYAEQKQYMEKNLPDNTQILKLSKQAMLAEHAGKYAEAKGYYEQLVSRKEAMTAAQGDAAWPMLHCAVQRMSELTGDEAQEKEMLVWIKANMLNPQGQFHQSLSNLMSEVIDHLEKRLKKYES